MNKNGNCIKAHKIPAFEGWYFRVVDNQVSAAVIIGIAKTQDKQEAFIQVFHTLCQSMEKVSYDIKDFVYQEEPFSISIKIQYLKNIIFILKIQNYQQS